MNSLLLRLIAPAIVTGLLLIGTALGSAWSIHRLQTNLTSILSEHVASVQATSDLENAMRQMRYHTLRYVVRPTAQTLAQIEDDESSFEDAFARATSAGTTEEEKRFLKQIDVGYQDYRDEMERLREEVARTGPQTDFGRYDTRHPIRHIVTPCQQLGKFNRDQLEATIAETEALSQRSRLVLVLMGLAGPIGGCLVGYALTRGLTRSLEKLRFRIRDVVDRLEAGTDSKGGVRLRLAAGDLPGLDRELAHIVQRIEELMARLQRQQRDMLRAEQLAAVGQLAAGVAHEVRNPLTGMKLLVEAAMRPTRPRPLCGEDLHVIHGEIARLEEIVQHFLDFARPQPLARITTDMREVVKRSLELTRGRARQQGVDLTLELPEDQLPVALDAGQFQTVMVNLLLNALDALPAGGAVRVKLDRLDGSARLIIHDTGQGIASELMPKLFTPFASGRATGTGLGLSLAKRIVQEHGGSIDAHNDNGACFVIHLPTEANSCRDSC